MQRVPVPDPHCQWSVCFPGHHSACRLVVARGNRIAKGHIMSKFNKRIGSFTVPASEATPDTVESSAVTVIEPTVVLTGEAIAPEAIPEATVEPIEQPAVTVDVAPEPIPEATEQPAVTVEAAIAPEAIPEVSPVTVAPAHPMAGFYTLCLTDAAMLASWTAVLGYAPVPSVQGVRYALPGFFKGEQQARDMALAAAAKTRAAVQIIDVATDEVFATVYDEHASARNAATVRTPRSGKPDAEPKPEKKLLGDDLGWVPNSATNPQTTKVWSKMHQYIDAGDITALNAMDFAGARRVEDSNNSQNQGLGRHLRLWIAELERRNAEVEALNLKMLLEAA
jgi:hypothetical protein